MKIACAHYLLLIYIIAICKPVLPVVKDFVAHVFWKGEHLTTVHHHAGDLHVHTEINEIALDNDEDKNTQTPKTSDSVSIHILLKDSYDFTYQVITNKNYFFKLCSFQSPFPEINSPPPKVG